LEYSSIEQIAFRAWPAGGSGKNSSGEALSARAAQRACPAAVVHPTTSHPEDAQFLTLAGHWSPKRSGVKRGCPTPPSETLDQPGGGRDSKQAISDLIWCC